MLADGAHSVTTFAYPYGEFGSKFQDVVQGANFAAARDSVPGFNTRAPQRYALKSEGVGVNTSFETVKGWIDTAEADGSWLVLVFHDVEPQKDLAKRGTMYGTSAEVLEQIISYLKDKEDGGELAVKTVSDAVSHLQ